MRCFLARPRRTAKSPARFSTSFARYLRCGVNDGKFSLSQLLTATYESFLHSVGHRTSRRIYQSDFCTREADDNLNPTAGVARGAGFLPSCTTHLDCAEWGV